VKVLVPGITGAIGRRFARGLLRAGHDVIGIDRRPYGAIGEGEEGLEVHQVDIRKRGAEDVFRRVRPDAVVHMATVTHLLRQSEDRYRINLQGTRAVFEHSAAYGVKHVVFIGRHTFYGAAPDSPLYHGEDEPPMALAYFPELADLVAADLFAGSMLWRQPTLATSVLRFCYTLGDSGHGTLATFLRGARVPTVLGYDPLFQFMHEDDVVKALMSTLETRARGVFNVAGPPPLPLSVVIRETGRQAFPVPEVVFTSLLGRFGLPRLSRGALGHIKYPVVTDDRAFRAATGFTHDVSEGDAMREFRRAFPPMRRG
jgi:UDP-glucose 4-epimerase